jgi:dipeptidyl aminopeptidase/acylaminoacyl peptidase
MTPRTPRTRFPTSLVVLGMALSFLALGAPHTLAAQSAPPSAQSAAAPSATAPATTAERALEAADFYRMVSLGDVEISPSGEFVAFTVTTIDEEENDRKSAIWLQELADGRPVGEPFRFTDPTRNSSSPQWSPDGSTLSFTSRRGEEDGSVWFIRVARPGGEAYRIDGVRASPLWSPDGGTIAFVAEPEEEEEKSAQERRVAPNAITQALDAKRFDGHVVTHRRYKSDGTFSWLPHPAHRQKSQLFVVPAEGGEARQLTDSPFNVRQVTWSPDGSWFAFSMNEMEDDELSLDPTGGVYTLPAQGGEPRLLVDLPGSQSQPAVSPDGRRVAFLHTGVWNAETEVMVVEVGADGTAQGDPVHVTAEWDRTPGAPFWTPDGRSIRWSATVNANTHVFEVDAGGGEVRAITQGDRSLGSVSVTDDGRFMAYTSTDPVSPDEVHVASADRTDGAGEVRLTGFNDAWVGEVALSPARRLVWTVGDGTEVEGWVIPPMGHAAGQSAPQSAPMILSIHGGPHSVYRNSFSSLFQILSGAGFYVLYINPRGSTSYGNEFKHAIHGGWGLIDEEDFITGVEAALRAFPDIDANRLGVTGGSYGGYMTNWLTARTDLFAAAVTRASISNWESLAKNTDSNLPHRPFDGASFQNRELYRASSPISYVENVTAPTLVIHGEHDFRTPLGEGEQWYQALQKMEIPSEFVLYPRSGHGIREPWLAADNQERTRQWFVHWLIDSPMRADGDH